jgi:hypothetical protein
VADATVWRTVVRVVVVVLVVAGALVSGAVVVVVASGTVTAGTLSVAGAVSVDGAVEGAVCVVSGFVCCANRGVEESAKAAAIAVAPSRAWSLCWVIVSYQQPFRFGGGNVIGGPIGNAAQTFAARLTAGAAHNRGMARGAAALTAGRIG